MESFQCFHQAIVEGLLLRSGHGTTGFRSSQQLQAVHLLDCLSLLGSPARPDRSQVDDARGKYWLLHSRQSDWTLYQTFNVATAESAIFDTSMWVVFMDL